MSHTFSPSVAIRSVLTRAAIALGAVFCLTLLFATQGFAGDDFRVQFEKKTAVDRDKEDDKKYGSGVKRVEKLDFEASVSYQGIENAKGVTVTFYIIGGDHVWERKDQELYIVGTYPHEGQEFRGGETKKYTMGPISFPDVETRKGNTRWRSGVKFEGWVAEFAKDGKIIGRVGKTPDMAKKVERSELKTIDLSRIEFK
ncbi:hypothetical protein DB346_18505 [Verrucomicrobia bacterium LW23]|nr:hypothetical protein DB346_18505 [Verrucomicrobia bacterium LW23]